MQRKSKVLSSISKVLSSKNLRNAKQQKVKFYSPAIPEIESKCKKVKTAKTGITHATGKQKLYRKISKMKKMKVKAAIAKNDYQIVEPF